MSSQRSQSWRWRYVSIGIPACSIAATAAMYRPRNSARPRPNKQRVRIFHCRVQGDRHTFMPKHGKHVGLDQVVLFVLFEENDASVDLIGRIGMDPNVILLVGPADSNPRYQFLWTGADGAVAVDP